MTQPISVDMVNTTPLASNYLEVSGVCKSFQRITVMEGMNIQVAKGELVSLLGPSGCGKTTLLRIIAGLVQADAGTVVLGARNITTMPAHKRNISVVFQNYALFPHLSVTDNVAFGLRARGVARANTTTPVADALDLVRMKDFANQPVTALSGGQQQRVAVARALVVQPDLLLLDEPFSALDRKLRETMQVELKSLLLDRGITAIFVTHDQDEALGVSDRIAVMNSGRIEQFADPSTLYARPASPFVMDFVGLSTRIAGLVAACADDTATVDTAYGQIKARADLPLGQAVTLGVRPELMGLAPNPGDNRVSQTLADVMYLGSKTMLHGIAQGEDRVLCELSGIQSSLSRGDTVTLGWAVDDTLIYASGA